MISIYLFIQLLWLHHMIIALLQRAIYELNHFLSIYFGVLYTKYEKCNMPAFLGMNKNVV